MARITDLSLFFVRPLVALAAAGGLIAPGVAQIVVLEDTTSVTIQGRAGPPLGTNLPEPKRRVWRAGERVGHGQGRSQVYAFYTTPRTPTLAGDVEYFVELARQFDDRETDFVVVVRPDAELPESLGPLTVVADPDNTLTNEWCGGEPGAANVLVLGPKAQLNYRGTFGRGVIDAIERTLSGKPAVDEVQKMWLELGRVAGGFDSSVGAVARRQIDPVLRHSPRDGHALALSYLIARNKERDAEKATTWRLAATDRLANLPRPLALFIDLALRGEAQPERLAKQLLPAIVPASALAANDPIVQLAYLRVLLRAGLDKQAGRQVATMQKLVLEHPEHAATLCELLTQAATPAAHELLCRRALAAAQRGGIESRRLVALRFLVALRCAENPAAAGKVVDEFVGENAGPSAINNPCWYLMTDVPTMGRYTPFAVALAERMVEKRDSMSYNEFDTAALAMFLDGRTQDAVELQEAAIQRGGRNDPEYGQRLQWYQAAAKAEAEAEDKAKDR